MIKWGGVIWLEGVPIPPDGGPRRTEFLRRRGTSAMDMAKASYYDTIEKLRESREKHLVERVDALYERGCTPDEWEAMRLALAFRWGREMPGEQSARKALGHAVDAYRDLRETVDGPAGHRQMHRIGALVGGLYGCWYEWDEADELWFRACAVCLAHSPLGLSVGMTGRWICSICRADASSCDHERGVLYPVEVMRDEGGHCNICLEKSCNHVVGQREMTAPSYICIEGRIHEATATKNPVEPRARFTRISMDPQPLPPNSPNVRLRCRSCLAPCDQM